MKTRTTNARANDEAVSPVIAVILMVAITVVLAAAVYVWVSGFNPGTEPARSISMISAGRTEDSNATYTVTSASTSLAWPEIELRLAGNVLAYGDLSDGPPSAYRYCVLQAGGPCEENLPTRLVSPADKLVIQHTGTLSGASLSLVDTKANSVMLTFTVR